MARSRSIGNIYAELSVRDKMSVGLRKAKKALVSYGKTASIAMGAATAAASGALVVGTKRALDQADALGDLSVATGVAVSDLMALRQAYKEGGMSAEKAAGDIGKMQKSIADAYSGDLEKVEVFKDLGIDLERIIQLSPADQFKEIGNAIMGVENMAKRVSAARDIFGKSGAGLISVFDNVKEVENSLGRMPILAEQFADSMGRANDLIGRLPLKSDQFFMGFTAGIVGQILPELEKTNEFDFTTLGENLGDALATGMEAVTSGRVWDLVKLQAESAFNKIMTSPVLMGVGVTKDALGKLISDPIGAWKNRKPGESIFDGVWNDAMQAAVDFDDVLQELIANAKADIQRGSAEKKADAKADESTRFRAEDFIVPNIGGILEEMQGKMKDVMKGGDMPEPDKKSASWQSSSYDVNDFQKRGLSFSKNGGLETKADKQVTLLTEIKDIIRRAESDGTLRI